VNKKNILKYGIRVAVTGIVAFQQYTIILTERQRKAEKQRADVISAMYGSLVDFVGIDAYNAWEARMEELYPLDADNKEPTAPSPEVVPAPVEEESGQDPAFDPAQLPEPVSEDEVEELETGEAIEIAAPIDDIPEESDDQADSTDEEAPAEREN